MDCNIQSKISEMIIAATNARKNSYTVYSNYKVGAALLLSDMQIITGCNIENASFGMTNCAERTAIFKAVSEGFRDFAAIAIVGGSDATEKISDYAFPCGACRQVMREFCNPQTFIVIVAKSVSDYKVYTLEDLLPESFGPENLDK